MKLQPLLLFLLMLTGCTSISDKFRTYAKPDSPAGSVNIDLVEAKPDHLSAAEPVEDWWNQLDDPILTGLVDASLKNNLDVKVAIANLAEARSNRRETDYDRYPTVTANAGYTRQRTSQRLGQGFNTGDNTFHNYQYGFDAFWELDLFDRISQRIAAQEALEAASLAELQNVYVSVAAEVARNYIELRGAQYRLDIAHRNAANQRGTLELTQTLSEGGRATELDVARAETQLNSTLATIPPLEASVYAAISRLSVLSGQIPDALRQNLNEKAKLPDIPETIIVGDVSGLIQRRPDIRRTERELAANVAQYNVAVTDLFPNVNILGTLGFIAASISSLGTGTALSASIGPSVNWAAFNLGRVRAVIDQNDARALAALANYEQTVLQALEELQTSIVNFSREGERRIKLNLAAHASAKAAKLARQRYDAGIDDFLDVLDAERVQLNTEDSLAVSEITTALNLITVYRALGGGWQIVSQ